ncbi:MAG: cell envelope integrity protein TolA [Pseudomonadota bacterium]|nr:cell envelope integrity protein TolA [Pseudomonadota bacterium]|tara:strand:+ start:1805 stop:2389 length:585 start_codon:yes stop_codon:yes gene_type:complete
MKWLTALFFSIIVHILIFFSYVLFTTESVENKSRKITNVSFLDEELQNKEEKRKSSKSKEKKQKKIDTKKVEEIKPKEIDNFEEYLKEEEIQKRISDNADVVEQISYKVIKDIEALWIRPNSAKIGMFADFNLRINRLGIIENIEMKQTSGDNAFDRAALNAIRKYKQIKYVRNLDDQTFQAYFSNFTLRFRPE